MTPPFLVSSTRRSMMTARHAGLIGLHARPASAPTVVALFAVALGALVLAGWVFGIPILLRIRPTFPSMPYTTALAFIASGGALLLLESGHRRSATAFAASAGALAIGASVWPDPGINQALHVWLSEHLFVAPSGAVAGVARLTAVSFGLFAVGVALLAVPRSAWARLSARLLGVGVGAVGASGVIGYLAGSMNAAPEASGVTDLAAHGALGLTAIGAGLVVLSTRELATVDTGGPRWLPAMVGIVSLVLTLAFWQLSLREVERLSAAAFLPADEPSRLPRIALGLGLALTVVLMAAVAAAQRASRRSRLFEDANRLLVEEGAERHRAQQELAALAAELHRSNRELEDFAAIASHDLRSPLVKLHGFAQVLREDYGATLDEDGRAVLERLVAIVSRMQVLVDDVLTLARVRARGKPFEPVDLTGAAHVVVADLESALAAASARVEIGTLPTVDADATQMRQLLQNLVANALKFRRPDVPAVVQIEGTLADPEDPTSQIELRVSDNGIGFEQKFAEHIFRPFERLHGSQEYEGSGIGLAVCARIVSRHGGTISAEGRPGEGAVFVVRLPAHHDERRA